MDEEMKNLGYSPRLIRVLNDKEKKFFIDNNEVIDNIKKRIKEEFSLYDDSKIIKSIIMGIDPISDTGFTNDVNQIIKSEIRDNKISKILKESVVSFTEYLNMTTFLP
jgi:hypothetical protein